MYKESKFEGSVPINILVQGEKNSVLAVSPVGNKLSVFYLDGKVSRQDASHFLGLPLDAQIKSNSLDLSDDPKGKILGALLSYSGIETDLSIFDRIRLFLFVQRLKSEDLETRVVSKNQSFSEIDKIVSPQTADRKIQDEGLSIEVVNASGIDGQGANIARIITNMGGNVILVSTSQSSTEDSRVEYKKDVGYTVNRLSNALRFEVKKHRGDSIADVIIVVGKEKEE